MKKYDERDGEPDVQGGAGVWARWWVLALMALLTAVLAWRLDASYDFGFHLATGRYILEHGWPRTDPFTYTVSNHPYITMHGFFQAALALCFRWGGWLGVSLMREKVLLITLALLWATALRRGARSPLLLAAGFFLGILTWEFRFMLRPELATDFFLALELYLLRRHAEDGRPGWLFALPAIQAIWVNSHALSLFGPVVLGVYALAGLFDRGAARDRASLQTRAASKQRSPSQERAPSHERGPSHDRAPWIALALSGVALFLNPYGAHGVAFLWGLHTRLQGSNEFAQSINELRSYFAGGVPNSWPVLAYKALLPLTVLGVLLRVRRLRLFDVGVTLLFAGLSVTAQRNVGLFVMVTLPIALEAWQGLLERQRRRPTARARQGRSVPAAGAPTAGAPARPGAWLPAAGLALATLLVFLVVYEVVNGGYYVSADRSERFGYGESAAAYPVHTTDLVLQHRLAGRLYNHMNFGGYLIGRLWPWKKVFSDARLEVMGDDFFRELRDIDAGTGWSDMVRRYQPDIALVPPTFVPLTQAVVADGAWAFVDADGAAALFVRRTPANRALIEESAARLASLDQRDDSTRIFAPPRRPSWLGRLLEPRRFPWDIWGRGVAFQVLGHAEAARKEYRRALALAGRDLPFLAVGNYAQINYKLGYREESRLWFEHVLDLRPNDEIAQQYLDQLNRMRPPGGASSTAPAGP